MLTDLYIFLSSCFFITCLYPNVILSLSDNALFRSLKRDKKLYIVKNIIKGIYLATLVFWGSLIIIPGLMHNHWDSQTIRIFGSLYCSNDFVGLMRVPHLSSSTKIHHVICLSLLWVSWNVDFQVSKVGQLIVLYTYFSAVAFPVNIYLGYRFLYKDTIWLKRLAKWTYILCCVLNWSLQLYWCTFTTPECMYLFLICGIVIDDMILIRWLCK